MKNLLLILFSLILFSCSKKGEIHTQPHDFIIIHNKVYKLMSIVPCDGCNRIWILYPKDSTDQMPEVINYNVKEGKHTVTETIIKVN